MKKMTILLMAAFLTMSCSGESTESINDAAVTNNSATNNQQPKTVNKCEQEYQNLLKENGEDFSNCKVTITDAECKKDGVSDKHKNLVIILDVSGSMAAQIQGKSRLEVAKSALNNYLKKADKNLNISLIAYGHKGSNQTSQKNLSCEGIETLVPMGNVQSNASVVGSKITPLQPTGWTPIAESLKQAESILNSYPEDKNINSILLLSDGKESCEGDPVKEAKRINEKTTNKIFIDVIGLDVSGADQTELKEIASSAGGKYFQANLEEDLRKVFEDHENEMEKFECDMEQFDTNLNQGLDSLFTYNDCVHRLEMEKFEFDMAIDTGQVSSNCAQYIQETYQKRFNEIKTSLNKNRQEEEAEVDAADPFAKDGTNDKETAIDIDEDLDVDVDTDW